MVKAEIKQGFNSNVLKLIAILSMTIDHLAWVIFPGFSMNPMAITMHILGRLACPIFCYFIAQGYIYTRNFAKYFSRIVIFALISHVPYVLNSFNFIDAYSFIPLYYSLFNQTSVLLGFACGLLLIRVSDSHLSSFYKIILSILICVVAFPADWSCVAPLIILFMWQYRDNFKAQMIAMTLMILPYVIVYLFAINFVYAFIQLGIVLAIPVLYFYNGERGSSEKINRFMKWFFYIYYPLHLTLLIVLSCFI